MKLKEKIKDINNDYPSLDWVGILGQKPTLTASFVIPSFNSENTIGYVVDAIANQSLAENIKELIIIDDGSTDRTLDILELYDNKLNFPLKVLKNDTRKYAAYSRNIGIRESSGDLVFFLDSDIVIPPNYMEYHVLLHQHIPDCISWSLRCFIDKKDFLGRKLPFPINDFYRDFRYSKIIPTEWCDSPERKGFADKEVRLIQDTNMLRNLGNFRSFFWKLPDTCLTCSICYKREDLLKVKGAPINFKGWGFNDISMAAKVISLGRYVIPVMQTGVYHINHPARSGKKKYLEFNNNKKRFQKMLEMEVEDTYKWQISGLEKI